MTEITVNFAHDSLSPKILINISLNYVFHKPPDNESVWIMLNKMLELSDIINGNKINKE